MSNKMRGNSWGQPTIDTPSLTTRGNDGRKPEITSPGRVSVTPGSTRNPSVPPPPPSNPVRSSRPFLYNIPAQDDRRITRRICSRSESGTIVTPAYKDRSLAEAIAKQNVAAHQAIFADKIKQLVLASKSDDDIATFEKTYRALALGTNTINGVFRFQLRSVIHETLISLPTTPEGAPSSNPRFELQTIWIVHCSYEDLAKGSTVKVVHMSTPNNRTQEYYHEVTLRTILRFNAGEK